MAYNLTQKIIKEHLVFGEMKTGEEIAIRIDHTLTQDSTGTMAYLQLEAMNIDKVKTKLSVAYIDHNTLQTGFENADDHRYIETVASKHGIIVSKPGNGICHQVQLERFTRPSFTLIGSDSHTPTAGGIGTLAIGAGGLDVAAAMAGYAYHLTMPKVVNVVLNGSLNPWVSSKDVILYLLKKLTVKGGVNKVFEYTGDGVSSLSVPERATITNMGAELGATTSIFPSDKETLRFMTIQKREKEWVDLKADEGASYDETVEINLSDLVPMIAKPHSPDNVVPVSEIAGIKVNQVAIGSCTNSSYDDLIKVAKILEGKTVHPDVSLVIAPGSRQVLGLLSDNGALGSLIRAGARILECACGPCIGMGQAPCSGGVSVRTFNRNFKGRSGTEDAFIYLASPEVAAVTALKGVLTDPRELGSPVKYDAIKDLGSNLNNNLFIFPKEERSKIEVIRGPNIKPFPIAKKPEGNIQGEIVLKVSDNITTDGIMPSSSSLLPFRSNIPHLANFCFNTIDKDFPKRCKDKNGGFIIAGANYGQGSSREHAALAPLYLGIKAVIVKSFARIHRSNLINFGILPLIFKNEADYEALKLNDTLSFLKIDNQIAKGSDITATTNDGRDFVFELKLSSMEKEIILNGGLLNLAKKKGV